MLGHECIYPRIQETVLKAEGSLPYQGLMPDQDDTQKGARI